MAWSSKKINLHDYDKNVMANYEKHGKNVMKKINVLILNQILHLLPK